MYICSFIFSITKEIENYHIFNIGAYFAELRNYRWQFSAGSRPGNFPRKDFISLSTSRANWIAKLLAPKWRRERENSRSNLWKDIGLKSRFGEVAKENALDGRGLKGVEEMGEGILFISNFTRKSWANLEELQFLMDKWRQMESSSTQFFVCLKLCLIHMKFKIVHTRA